MSADAHDSTRRELLEQMLDKSCIPRVEEMSTGQRAQLACLLEATTPKPGNVHPEASFDDLCYQDFVTSAAAIVPAIQAAADGARLGQSVRIAVEATRKAVGTNTNLGTLLLIVPLAQVPHGMFTQDGISQVFAKLTAADATDIYAAINTANAGGLGKVDNADIQDKPPDDLLAAMQLAAQRDLVARQYVHAFQDVREVRDAISSALDDNCTLRDSIIVAHIRTMAANPDSLIARKCGDEIAGESARRAQKVLDAAKEPSGWTSALREFDDWLRADGHRRNPGTTADLIAAALFLMLCEA